MVSDLEGETESTAGYHLQQGALAGREAPAKEVDFAKNGFTGGERRCQVPEAFP